MCAKCMVYDGLGGSHYLTTMWRSMAHERGGRELLKVDKPVDLKEKSRHIVVWDSKPRHGHSTSPYWAREWTS